MTIKIYKDQNAGAVFIENANGVQFLNALQATMDEPTDVKINIHDLSKDVDIFTQVPFGDFVDDFGVKIRRIVLLYTQKIYCNVFSNFFHFFRISLLSYNFF